MPNIWTHIIFGKHLLTQMGADGWINCRYKSNIYNMGCQGPDFLFYHRFQPWKKLKYMNELGGLMHKEQCGSFLLEMMVFVREHALNKNQTRLQSQITPEALYALGFLTHHVLDRNMHPFIFYKSGFAKWKHQRYEVIIDTIMARKFLGLETWKTPVWKLLDIGEEFTQGIVDMFAHNTALFYPEVNSHVRSADWNEAYRDMIRAQKLFHDPYGIKQAMTFGQIEPLVYKKTNAPLDYLNETNSEWNDPTCLAEKYTLSAWDLWDQAIHDGQHLMQEALNFLANKPNDLAEVLGNVSYETGKPCVSGLEIQFVNPII